MKRILIIAVMLLAGGITAFAQIDFDLPRPEVMDPATDPVRADSARVRAERKADALAAMALIPARLSSGTVIALYKSGDPNNVWGKYHDSVEAARDKAENDYYKKRTTVMTDALDIGGLGYTAAQLEGMSEAEKQAFAIQARDAGLSEYGISMSDLKQGMTEDEAKKVVGKMMEAKYGGINMQELDQYMNADEKDRQKITKDALKKKSRSPFTARPWKRPYPRAKECYWNCIWTLQPCRTRVLPSTVTRNMLRVRKMFSSRSSRLSTLPGAKVTTLVPI